MFVCKTNSKVSELQHIIIITLQLYPYGNAAYTDKTANLRKKGESTFNLHIKRRKAKPQTGTDKHESHFFKIIKNVYHREWY